MVSQTSTYHRGKKIHVSGGTAALLFFLGVLVGIQLGGSLNSSVSLESLVASAPKVIPKPGVENEIPATRQKDRRVSSRDPAWPQQDNSIREAIQNGHRIDFDQTPIANTGNSTSKQYYRWNGTKCEPPPKGMATVITAYYDIKSKHPTHQYEEWIQNILKVTDPMIIFVDPTSDYKNWWPTMKQGRRHAPTLLVSLPFRNLTMSKVFSDEFWKKYVFPRDKQRRFKKGVDVYKIWNEKMILVRETALENPFDTEFFYWIDAGYFRGSGPGCSPIVRNNITEKGVKSNQLVYQQIHGYPSYEIAGGAWGGSASAILLHYQYYWKTFWYLTLYSNTECPGYEQRVLVWMCRSIPDICVINKSENWFKMGKHWLRDAGFNFLRATSTIPKDNTTTVPPMPETFNAEFPSDSYIRHIDQKIMIPKGKRSVENSTKNEE